MNNNNWSLARTCDKCSCTFRLSDHTNPGGVEIAHALDTGGSTSQLPMVMTRLCPKCNLARNYEILGEAFKFTKAHPIKTCVYGCFWFQGSWLQRGKLMAIGAIATLAIVFLLQRFVPGFKWQLTVIALSLIVPAFCYAKPALKYAACGAFGISIPLFSAAGLALAFVFHHFESAFTWQIAPITGAVTTLLLHLLWATIAAVACCWKTRDRSK